MILRNNDVFEQLKNHGIDKQIGKVYFSEFDAIEYAKRSCKKRIKRY